MNETKETVGCDGQGAQEMSQLIANRSDVQTAVLSLLFVALLGAGLTFMAGHAQSATLHDAAHDIRHGTGFPCH